MARSNNRQTTRARNRFALRLATAPASNASEPLARLEPLEGRILFAVFNVNSTADILSPPAGTVTLRSAIEAANATPGGNTINLTVPGVYRIKLAGRDDDANATGDFDILATGGNLTIQNTSRGQVIVDAHHLDRAFDINPSNPGAPFTVTMQGFAIVNGLAASALNPDGAAASGGAIRDNGNASLTLNHMTLAHDSATADGGAVSMENIVSAGATLTLNGTRVTNNHAGDAGGGVEGDGSGTINIAKGSILSHNTSVNQGGGIWLDAIQSGATLQSENLNVSDTLITGNSALSAGTVGGGIGNAGNGAVTLTATTITDNFSAGIGGGFGDENGAGTLTVTQSLIRHNSATGNGGGIAENGPSLTITTSEIDNNTTGSSGGAIFANGVQLVITRATLAGNMAAISGGGIELQTIGTASQGSSLTDVTLYNNQVLSDAGGADGGGIDAGTGFFGSLSLLNDTINQNAADTGGGIFWAGNAGSSISLQNTILADNQALVAGPDAFNAAGTFTDNGGNLIGASGAGSGNTGFTAGTTQSGTAAKPLDPLLGPLQYNGGGAVGTPAFARLLRTEAPLPGSPAIGKGVVSGAPAIDERGFPMVVNGQVNVGAVAQNPPIRTTRPPTEG